MYAAHDLCSKSIPQEVWATGSAISHILSVSSIFSLLNAVILLILKHSYRPYKEGHSAKATPYQLAAGDGSYTKDDCRKKYRCFFDSLDLAVFLIDWYRLNNDPEYEPTELDFK